MHSHHLRDERARSLYVRVCVYMYVCTQNTATVTTTNVLSNSAILPVVPKIDMKLSSWSAVGVTKKQSKTETAETASNYSTQRLLSQCFVANS